MQLEEDTEWRAAVKQDEAVTTLNHNKMLRRLRFYSEIFLRIKLHTNSKVIGLKLLQQDTGIITFY